MARRTPNLEHTMSLRSASTRVSRNPAVLASVLLLALAAPIAGQDQAAHHGGDDAAAVTDVVERFHGALAAGDSAAARALLAPEAVILESGGIETVDEYTSHHLAADMAFAAAVASERGPIQVTVRGDVAWAVSTSRSRGRYGDRDIDSTGAELVVLSRGPEGWRIEAVHWSSRNNR